MIQNITNLVVMQHTENILLAAGASSSMSSNIAEEFDDLHKVTDAVSINIGTLDAWWIDNITQTLRFATTNNLPVIFDPVASGATKFRTEFARKITKTYPLAVIRANPAEILSLDISQDGQAKSPSKGVDSTIEANLVLASAKRIAINYNTVVAMTGQDDYIANGKLLYKLSNGHPIMQKITGMGCALSTLIAAFVAVEADHILAATAAVAVYGVVGTIVGEKAIGPGSFQQLFLDNLYTLKKQAFFDYLQIT